MERCKHPRGFTRLFLKLALVLLISLALPTQTKAARRVTVDDVSRTLAAARSAGLADSEVAQRIAALDLSERPSTSTVQQWIALSPGPRTTEAVTSLANVASFLDPPSSAIPSTPLPDVADQRRIVSEAIEFVSKSLYHLPDFFADRVTTSYDDSPHSFKTGDWPIRLGIHAIGQANAEITFRDGRETDAPTANGKAQIQGLTSWGEFGPILSVVITDAAKGQLKWGHWEQDNARQLAVFQFVIGPAQSHYIVNYCCVAFPGEPTRGNLRLAPTEIGFHQSVGYHGTLSIDPATGTIVRLVVQADLTDKVPIRRADIFVEYGKVHIGDKEFVCPIRSISIAVVPDTPSATSGDWSSASACPTCARISAGTTTAETNDTRLLLNEVYFQNYHHFESSARVFSTQDPATGRVQEPISPKQEVALHPDAASQAETVNAAPTATVSGTSSQTASEVSTSPAQSVAQPVLTDRLSSLKVTSRLVNIGLFASDKKGHPVLDLTAQDLEIYDDGQRQPIKFFTPPLPAVPVQSSPPRTGPRTYTNRADEPSPEARASVPSTIMLIDEAHIAWTDLNNIRQQILRFLSTCGPGDPVGLYTTPGNSLHIVVEPTEDHAAVISVLQKWIPSAQSIALAQEEERRNRQLFDEVSHPADLAAVNGHPTDEQTLLAASDPELRRMGDDATRDSFVLLVAVARHLAAIPGRKSVVWISSDNAFATWRDRAIGAERGPDPTENPARYALEAMNNAQVSVYPLDASQLEGGAIGAEIQHRNVELTQAAADVAALAGGSIGREMTPGRNIEQMHQDTLAIQEPIRQVAEATGGRIIRRASNQAANLASIVDESRAFYLVSFSPTGPADNKYHNIKIKTLTARDVVLRYRSGYFFGKEPETLKERFQQAVWQPADMAEISLDANAINGADGTTINLTINTSDIAFQQQQDRWIGNLDLLFVARDDAGLRAHVDGQTLALRLTAETYRDAIETGIPITHLAKVRSGETSVRVLVVDRTSGRIGTVTIPAPELSGSK
jgi:VWFA-related protein